MAQTIDITKIKVKLQIKDRFLACIAMMIDWVPDTSISTASVSNTKLYYNPSWFGNLSIDEQVGLIAHECMHIALQHPTRCYSGNFHQPTYNMCADMVINRELIHNKYELPPGGVTCPPMYNNLCTEEIYKELEQIDDYESDLVKPSKEEDRELKKIMSSALMGSKGSYSLKNSEIQRSLESLFKPKLPWTVLLHRYVNGYIREDYLYKKPNRRYLDIAYLPSINDTDSLTRINVYIDVSGSIDNTLVNKFLSEVKGIFNNYKPEEIRINLFSIHIDKTVSITSEWKDIEVTSGGGTKIIDVIDDINKYRACISIIFTDGEFNPSYISNSKYPILWVIHDNSREFKPSKGKVIEIDM